MATAAFITAALTLVAPCAATIVWIDWVEQPILPLSLSTPLATEGELPVIFPEFPRLFSDATWKSYLKYSVRAQREAEAFKAVKYTPGTVFKHRLFGYRGVIMGVTPTCEASEQWIQQMRVDDLPGGRLQPFYWTMVDIRDRPVSPLNFLALLPFAAFSKCNNASRFRPPTSRSRTSSPSWRKFSTLTWHPCSAATAATLAATCRSTAQ